MRADELPHLLYTLGEPHSESRSDFVAFRGAGGEAVIPAWTSQEALEAWLSKEEKPFSWFAIEADRLVFQVVSAKVPVSVLVDPRPDERLRSLSEDRLPPASVLSNGNREFIWHALKSELERASLPAHSILMARELYLKEPSGVAFVDLLDRISTGVAERARTNWADKLKKLTALGLSDDDIADIADGMVQADLGSFSEGDIVPDDDDEFIADGWGHVYVLANPSLPGQVKIGHTLRDPEERARELSAVTGLPTPFVLIYSEEFEDAPGAERIVHQLLAGYRISDKREFFAVPPKRAIDVIRSLAEQEEPY